MAARGIRAGDFDLVLSGGVESTSRAPFVMPKVTKAFARENAVYDTTIGWRFVNPRMKNTFGIESMPQTADCVAADYGVSRADQDAFAIRSQERWVKANAAGIYDDEIIPVDIPQGRGNSRIFDTDEHPRLDITIEKLAKLKGVNGPDLSVTAGNSSGVNDGAAALLIASEQAAARNGLTPKSRVVAMAAAGVEPHVMGIGPIPAARKVLARAGLTFSQMDVIELNEAFAAQSLAVLRELGLADDASS